jgi:RNA polymerase sigma factor (sigma-70 family)
MSDEEPIAELIRRVRLGDGPAAEALVRRYEPLIRREVRFRLEDARLRRVFDSMDVCQSVLASFFVRAAAGQFDLERPEDLPRLLVTIARNKVASQARKQATLKRDRKRATAGDTALAAVADLGPSPSVIVADAELLERFRSGLDSEERAIADLRAEGLGWAEVAQQLGGTPQARRMQFARAADRVARTLGLDDSHDA